MHCDSASLRRIQDAVALKAVAGGFLQPLKSFLFEMPLEWGAAPTAYSTMRGRLRAIVLGRKFFAEQVQGESEAAEIVLHEIMHHLFHHLLMVEKFAAAGYNHNIQNVAEDAIINAFLHNVGCASFMARYYPDEGVYAFLRSGSSSFLTAQDPQDSEELKKIRRQDWFYRRLYELGVTLEEALAFFQAEFPEGMDQEMLLGSHAQPTAEESGANSSDSTPGEETEDSDGHSDDVMSMPGSFFSNEDADYILRSLGFKEASLEAKSNFAQVIRQVRCHVNKPGSTRTGIRMSRRLKSKLSRRDQENLEKGRELFVRGEYKLKRLYIFFDVSGSVSSFVPFVVDLIRSLRLCDMEVHLLCWATTLAEASLADLTDNRLPDVGSNDTRGEEVSKYIATHQVPEAIIITDNFAGDITTPIQVPVHLVLMGYSAESGSFLDRNAVPQSTTYHLVLQ